LKTYNIVGLVLSRQISALAVRHVGDSGGDHRSLALIQVPPMMKN